MAENTIRIEGLIPTNGAMPVSGSITTTPSGTQVVSGTVTTVPSGTQTVTGTVTSTPSGTQAISGTITSVPGVPTGANFYSSGFSTVIGLVTSPYNFLSIFNPLASGKTVYVVQSIIIPWATAVTATTNAMETFRTSAASAGTLLAAANVNKFANTSPNSITEVRTANPTITTTGVSLGGAPPSLTAAAQGASGTTTITAFSGAPLVLAPGEGLCMRQIVAGTVNQLWNLGFIWYEA